MSEPSALAPDTQDQAAPSDLSSLSEDLGKRWITALEGLRKRTDTTAKTIGGLGTLAITAAGLSKFSDVFPLPPSPSAWQVLAILGVLAGLVAMGAAVAWFTVRLTKVASPIFMRSDPSAITDISLPERVMIATIYGEIATLNDASSFEAYATRGLRLQRVAQRGGSADVRSLAATEAKQVNADVLATQARAATHVVRQRAQDAIRGPGAVKAYVLFLVALLAFGIGADYLDSERTARVASARDCAEAITAIRTADPSTATPAPAKLLPKLCGGEASVPVAASGATTPETETSGAVTDVATRYDACIVAAEGDTDQCTRLKAGLDAIMR